MKYTKESLIEYCNNNNIILTENDELISRECFIKGHCIQEGCIKLFNKNFRQLVKTGGYCEDCMKIITSKKIKENKVVYDKTLLTDFCNLNNISPYDNYENIFVNRDTVVRGKCLTADCSYDFTKPFRQLLKINGYCEICSKENGKEKIKATNLKLFGFENVMKNDEVKKKLKTSILEKYGVEHNSQCEEIKTKKTKTFMKNYGFTNNFKSPEVRNQIKETNIKLFGFENPQQNKEIKEKNKKNKFRKIRCRTLFSNGRL